MKGIGMSALVLSVIAVFIPFGGVFISGLSGLLVCFSAFKSNKYSVAALIINLANLFFLSPMFFIAAMGEGESGVKLPGPSLGVVFWSLVGVQLLAVIIFLASSIVRPRSNE
ncbi:hypothetical protein [Marinobacter sp. ANT_B65]|uniref:hypothetical protein n=1 Tax=Marinobacter sp. ANT_B65 TaxID=2039467 RepID=UPI00117E8685|nr:hypothetical protein [Marinobacter sp. ANT_B65]